MAVTVATDIFSQEAYGGAVTGVAFASVPMLAIPGLVTTVEPGNNVGGDTITFSHWNTSLTGITQPSVRTARAGVTPSKVSLADYQEAAVSKTISIDIDSMTQDDSAESVRGHIAEITGAEFGRTLQDLLIANAINATTGTTLALDITAQTLKTMNVDSILEARLKWGDHAGEFNQPYLFMHSAQFTSLAKSSDYKTLAGGGNTALVRGVDDWSRFVVGQVHGVNLCLLDNAQLIDASTPNKYTALMVAPGAFGAFIGTIPSPTVIRHPGSTVVTIDSHLRIATTLYRHAPRRVVKLVTHI